jgi:hypothetical protein
MALRLPIHLLLTVAVCATISCSKYDAQITCNTPMTYEEALSKKLDFPLPKGCSNVNYAMVMDWQLYDCYVRFEAPVDVCLRHMDTVIAWENQVYKTNRVYPTTEMTHFAEGGGGDQTIPASWFDLDKIHHGVEAGTGDSHQPKIWVDTNRGVFYYHETD